MRKIIIATSVLLVFQILLAGLLHLNRNRYNAFVPEQPFVWFNPADITSLTITDQDGVRLLIQKDKDSWLLPEAFDVPADRAKIKELLDKLAEQKKGFVVAATSGAAARFKVSPDDFERRVVLKTGDSVAVDLYLGKAAGYRQTHARLSSQDDIVTVALGIFEVEPSIDDWIDSHLLKREPENIDTVTYPDFEITRAKEAWLLSNEDSDKALNGTRVEELLESIGGLTVLSVLDPETVAPFFEKEPVLRFSTVAKDNEKAVSYTFAKPDDAEDYYVLKRSDLNFYFKMYNWLVEDLQKFNRTYLTSVDKAEDGQDTNEDAQEREAAQ